MKYSLDVSQGCSHFKAKLGLNDLLPRWLVHTCDCGQTSDPHPVGVTTQQGNCLPPEKVMQKKWKNKMEATLSFKNLILEVTYHFCQILLATQTNPGTMLRELYKEVNTRRWGSLEAIFYKLPSLCFPHSFPLTLQNYFNYISFCFIFPLLCFEKHQEICTYIHTLKTYSLLFSFSASCLFSVNVISYWIS